MHGPINGGSYTGFYGILGKRWSKNSKIPTWTSEAEQSFGKDTGSKPATLSKTNSTRTELLVFFQTAKKTPTFSGKNL